MLEEEVRVGVEMQGIPPVITERVEDMERRSVGCLDLFNQGERDMLLREELLVYVLVTLKVEVRVRDLKPFRSCMCV